MEKLEKYALEKNMISTKAELHKALALVKEVVTSYMKEASVGEKIFLSDFITLKKVKYAEREGTTKFGGKEFKFKVNTQPKIVAKFTKLK